MAPGTNLGAASPVSIGFAPCACAGDGDSKKAVTPDTHERKAMQDAAAYIRSLAQLRGRNAEWAEKAVTDAASLSADEAKARNVADIVATDTEDLLRQLDGRKAVVAGGRRACCSRRQHRRSPSSRTGIFACCRSSPIRASR